MKLTHRSAGFTRLELLAVMAMVFLLLVNAAPAVMQAREAALLVRCKSNLRVIGIALHNYHDSNRVLPPGFVMRNWDSATQQGFGWQCHLLPYIDQAPMYQSLSMDGDGLVERAKFPEAHRVMLTPIPVYRCPTDVTPAMNPFRGNWPTSNYSGSSGHVPFPRLMGGIASDFWPGQMPTPPAKKSVNSPGTLSGLFQVNSSINFSHIPDGTSNTLMVGERGIGSLSGIWVGVTAASHENDVLTDTSHFSRPNQGWSSFSSSHKGSFHAMLADTSVRRIADSINSQPNLDPQQPLGVLQRLGCRNDGQSVEF